MDPGDERQQLETEREELLERVTRSLEPVMTALGFAWLLLLVLELVRGLSPTLQACGTAIWVLFAVDFVLEFLIAPRKRAYLEANWLVALSLAAPALRVLRVARLARLFRTTRAVRGLRLLRIVSSLNRGTRALGAAMGRRGFGYVAALTLLVTLVGAAGMYAFEGPGSPAGTNGLRNYGEALWWTAMVMTTMGSAYWPQTDAGRVLCLILALYAFTMFGYVTATLASFFVGRDAERDDAEVAGARAVDALHQEVVRLREEIVALRATLTRR